MDSQLIYNDSKIKDAWRLFVNKGIVRREILKNDIAYSWVRSRLHGIELDSISSDSKITGEVLRQFQKRDEALVNVCNAFIPNLEAQRALKGIVIGIANRDGLVLKTYQTDDVETSLVCTGRRMSEEALGTNGAGTAIKTSKDIVVFGAEHYSKAFQKYVTYGVHILDSNEEHIGLLVALSHFTETPDKILEKMREVADIVGQELDVHVDNRKLLTINDHLDNIIDSIPDALLCVDHFGEILDFNSKAEIMFIDPLSHKRLKGENIRNLIQMDDPMGLEQMLNGVESQTHWEGYYQVFQNWKPCDLEVISMKRSNSNVSKNILIRIIDLKELYKNVNRMIGNKARYTVNDIVGSSDEIESIRRLAIQHADSLAPVLILGEKGTGKKILAQSIHNAGSRQNESFYHLDCQSIPKKQIESELFGHVSSYSTLGRHQKGLMEIADAGTLYISSIEEMPLQTQLKLLKYLEEKTFSKLGSSIQRSSNVRLLVGSQIDLEIQVGRGSFRTELYNRIRMIHIEMTPIRERKNDIPYLIKYLCDEISYTQNKRIKAIETCFYDQMSAYHWPGNVREMHNVLQYIFYKLKDEATLTSELIPEHLFEGIESAHLRTTTLKIDDIEKEAILKAIEITDENLSKAAKLLGIGRSTLYRKIDKYNIKLYQNDTLFDVKMGTASK